MKKLLSILLVCFLIISCKQSQQKEIPKGTGLIQDNPADIATVPLAQSVSMRGEVASRYVISMPPVEQQGGWGPCVPFTVAYAMVSTEIAYRTNAEAYDKLTNLFSPQYVYGQVKFNTDCSSGTTALRCLDLVSTQGVCLWNTMPYDYLNGDCNQKPNAAQQAEAANYKLPYSKIDPRDKATVKATLSANHPIAVSISAEQGFRAISDSQVYNGSLRGPVIHEVTLCGYDDSKNAYLVQNSWGTGWGYQGRAWLNQDSLIVITGWYYAFVPGVTCPTNGTLLRTQCNGFDKYGIYADGNCGETSNLIQSNSSDCGYVPPSTDTTKPVVTIISPADGSLVPKQNGKNVNISATATDNIGVTSMRILVDGATKTTCPASSCSFVWSAKFAAAGNHVIKVDAVDQAGNIGSKSVTVKK